MRMKQLQGYTVGPVAPSNPRAGDRWQEMSLQGVSLYGWDWIFSAGRWVAPEQQWTPSFNMHVGERRDYLDPDIFHVQVLKFQSKIYHFAAQNSTNFYQFRLRQSGLNNVQTEISELTTTGSAAGVITQRSNTIAGIYNTQNSLIEITTFINGSPGNILGSLLLRYQFVRP